MNVRGLAMVLPLLFETYRAARQDVAQEIEGNSSSQVDPGQAIKSAVA